MKLKKRSIVLLSNSKQKRQKWCENNCKEKVYKLSQTILVNVKMYLQINIKMSLIDRKSILRLSQTFFQECSKNEKKTWSLYFSVINIESYLQIVVKSSFLFLFLFHVSVVFSILTSVAHRIQYSTFSFILLMIYSNVKT